MKNLFSYLRRGQCGRFAATLLLVIASSLFEVMLAYVMMRCVDFAMDGSLSQAAGLAIWLALYLAAYFAVDYLAKRLKWKTLQTAQVNLRGDVAQKLMAMPIRAFRETNTGGWLAMLTNQCDMIEQSYFTIWFGVFSDAFTFLVSAVVLCFVSPALALFVFVTAAIQMLVPKIMGPKIAKRKSAQMEAAEGFTVTATEHLNGFDLLKSFHLTAQSLHSICEASGRWEDTKFKTRMATAMARLLSFTFGQILYVGIFFFGALLTLSGAMTVGGMIVASQLVVYIASPLQTLSEDVTEIKSAAELIKSLREELSRAEQANTETVPLPEPFKRIEIENISFSYGDTPIFDDASIDIARGGKYLLCGPSGSGKSTLIELLTGAERPERGRVCIDGVALGTLAPEQLARFILPCTQSTFVFNASLRDNVALFDERFSDEDILNALKAVEFSYLLDRYDDGLDHMIAQGGQSLSGGERQKIALARMELFDPPVVVFDESFANLDAAAARRLIELALSNKERTVIVVAHQLADEIAGLFDRKIVIADRKIYMEDAMTQTPRQTESAVTAALDIRR